MTSSEDQEAGAPHRGPHHATLKLYLTVHINVGQVGQGRAASPVAARPFSAIFQTWPLVDGIM